MNEKAEIIQIRSDSDPNKVYLVNLNLLTCTCLHFQRKLKYILPSDPKRLCKHLLNAINTIGIPDNLKEFGEDIKQGIVNSLRKSEKLKQKQIPLPIGSVKTSSFKKAKKYCYLNGEALNAKFSVTFPISGGYAQFKINNLWGKWDWQNGTYDVPEIYNQMMPALTHWIAGEYEKAFGRAINRSELKLHEPLSEEAIKTISAEKRNISDNTERWYEFPEIKEHYYIIGEGDGKEIHLIIPLSEYPLIFWVENSKSFLFDVAEKKIIDPTEPLSIVISTELCDEANEINVEKSELTDNARSSVSLSKRYRYMEHAIIKWITDEYNSRL